MSFGFESTAEEVTEGCDLTGQSWLITGVNSGLGKESARVLSKRGARIIGLARTEDKARTALEELGAQGAGVACDLSDPDSVRGAVATIGGLGELHGIMGNAGIMALPEHHETQGIELQFYTNHFGHFGLVTGILDQLTDKGRVVMLSSGAHFMAKRGMEFDNLSGAEDYDAWRAYGRSKLANILFVKSLSRRMAAAGRRQTANAVHPGVIATNLARHVPNKEAMFDSMRARMKTVEQGAATQCFVAVNPAATNRTGEYFADCSVAKTLDIARDEAAADKLWEISEAHWA